MISNPYQPPIKIPYKSMAAALLFTVVLGPVGLLYASFWGGLFMIAVGIIIISSKLFFSTFLFWIFCCVWAVGACESHNRKLYQGTIEKIYAKTNCPT